MASFVRFLRKIRLLFGRERFRDELNEEMAFHRAAAENAFVDEGMAAGAARYAARRQFGNVTRMNEQSHEVVGFHIETIAHDIRFAIRQLRKNPGFAGTSVLVLALGIAASVSIFAFADAALLRPLPYREPGRLVNLFEKNTLGPRFHLSYLDYLDWKRLNHVFKSMDIYEAKGYILATPAGAQWVRAADVSDGFFHTLGVAPALGRDFHSGEDLPSAPRSVLLSYAAWQSRFGGRTDAVGQTVTLNGATTTIIGVLPRDFHFAPAEPAEFWTTVHTDDGCAKQRGCHNYLGVARLKNGISPALALADITTIAVQLTKQYPDSNTDRHAYLLPLAEVIVGDIRPILLVLLGGAALLLLIASVNVASLLLVRSESRRREIAVRGALGASRLRLLRQFVTEGLVLAAAGSVLGLTCAYGAMQLLERFIPTGMMASMPYLRGLGLNFHVIVFACVISLAAGVLFSLTPVVRLPGTAIRAGLTEGGRGAAGTTWRRFGSNLVVVELAAATVLLVGAGLLGQSFYRLLHVDTEIEPDHLAAIAVVTPASVYAEDAPRIALERQILGRVTRLPDVTSAGIASDLPVGDGDGTTTFRIPGRPYRVETNEVNDRMVSAGYFATVQARLLRGRYFLETEDASKPRIVIVNEALARKYFPGQDPVGQRIGDDQLSAGSLKEIVGVVDDIKEGPLDMTPRPAYYQPFNQATEDSFYLVVRTAQAEASLFPALTAAIHEIDPGIATYGAVTMSERIQDSPSAYLHRSSAYLVGGFAGLALLLGVVGLYGVIAYSVSQRTREIGVRMALGAQRSSIYKLILKEAAWLTALGIGAGLGCSIATAMLTRKLLYGVDAWDVSTFVAVAMVLAAAAMMASYLPAHRAASVNPVEALRAE
jgi:macrolide transport system ATP-binding/permease protein